MYEGFVVYSDSTVDKVNFVIFVIKPLLLELQVDKTARLARHFALTLHTLFCVFECLDPGVRNCVSNLVTEHSLCSFQKIKVAHRK